MLHLAVNLANRLIDPTVMGPFRIDSVDHQACAVMQCRNQNAGPELVHRLGRGMLAQGGIAPRGHILKRLAERYRRKDHRLRNHWPLQYFRSRLDSTYVQHWNTDALQHIPAYAF